ncbi:MAG: hypothetical protein QF666_04365, partial [Alphaproteobacteria bacterium]|nr:hypothetical protein [Alphaproteobacteria bacterium]
FVLIPEAEIDVTYTDNRDLAQWTCQTMIRGGGNQFDHDMPVEDAALGRQGDVRENPSWCIESKDHTIESTWTVEEPAVIYWGPAPSRTSAPSSSSITTSPEMT